MWTCLLAGTFSLLFAIMAYLAGQDANWDFYNYHFYNAYAFLNDRFWFDIQPAQRQTFFSPFLDIPFYWLTIEFGTISASIAYAVFQSWQAPAIFILAYLFLKNQEAGHRAAIGIAAILTVLAVFSPLNLQLAGATTGDSTTATLVLWGFTFFVVAQSEWILSDAARQKKILFFLAGILTGIAVGLKLTNGPFALALLACVFLVAEEFRLKLQIFLIISISCLLGFILAYGYWAWFLYDQFQNPLFPLFNHVFESEYMKSVGLVDDAYKATSFQGMIFYPFLYNAYTGSIYHQQFGDLRIPIVYVLNILVILAMVFSGSARWRLAANPICSGILLYNLVAYLVWLQLFSVMRYVVVLEVLSPLAVAAAACIVFRRKGLAVAFVAVALIPIAISSGAAAQSDNAFGSRTAWGDSTFEVRFPDFELEGAMVLVSGGQAVSFIIPSAPPHTRFIRIDSNLNYVAYESIAERYDNRMGQRLRQAIASHGDSFYIIYSDGEEKYIDSDLDYFDIERQEGDCALIESKGPLLIICRAARR